jgi:sterol carrier protein 2
LQLRGEADKRQVKNAKVGLQQNFGLGSTAVITLYRKYKPLQAKL